MPKLVRPRPGSDQRVLRRGRRLSQHPDGTIVGRTAIRDFIAGFLTTFEAIDFDIHHQIASGNVVMNERTDTLRSAGRETPLPVMGFFEVTDGAITTWRDYFDMAAINRAFGL
ncbi:nuclear transport factor 2 family protein [Nocardia abscessus]|nr:nuclear transport factor 2 family protein [Nocardia abscessus]